MKYIKLFENFDIENNNVLPPIDVDDNSGDDDNGVFEYNYKLIGLKYTIEADITDKENIKSLDYDVYKEQNRFNKHMTEYGYICMKSNNFHNNFFSIDVYLSPKLPRNQMKVIVKDLINEVSRILYENTNSSFKFMTYLDYSYWEGACLFLHD